MKDHAGSLTEEQKVNSVAIQDSKLYMQLYIQSTKVEFYQALSKITGSH